MKTKRRKRLEPEYAAGIVRGIQELVGVKIDTDALDRDEALELKALLARTSRRDVEPEHPLVAPDENCLAVRSFCAELAKLPAPRSCEASRSLIAEYARALDRVPRPEEMRAIEAIASSNGAATLADVKAAALAAGRVGRLTATAGIVRTQPSLALLTAAERERFEALVEQAMGEPGRFERLRKERDVKARMAELLERVTGPKPKKRPGLQEGSVVLPGPLLLHDLEGDEKSEGMPYCEVADLGVLLVIASIFESRLLPGRCQRLGWQLAEDADVLTIPKRFGLPGDWRNEQEVSTDRCLRALDRCKLLDARLAGGVWTIKPGPRLPAEG